MQVYCLSELGELAPYAADWDRLAGGVPFWSWSWLSAWWRHYGEHSAIERPGARLFVPCVFDHSGALVGLAPWYVDCRSRQGRVVRPLGSGEVCSDYLSVLCQPAMEYQVTEALADYLSGDQANGNLDEQGWDLLELSGFDAQDAVIDQLIRHLSKKGNTVHRRAGPNCWRIELPTSWDEYLAMLSKSHRKQLRRLDRRMLASGRAVLHVVEQMGELPRGIEILIDLHQRRRRSLGGRGCFSSQRFDAFHREVMSELLRAGQLLLCWLELDGRPVAAEYQLAGDGVVYAYQAGVEPEALAEQPGRMIMLATLRRAIEGGCRGFDFLRGDEPYKAHFRAQPRPSLEVHVVPNRTSARVRHNLWLAGNNVKQWVKGGLKLVAARED
jgi:CelD/BcsL family acetyltransferase involved in cellulose biosynthesis